MRFFETVSGYPLWRLRSLVMLKRMDVWVPSECQPRAQTCECQAMYLLCT